MADEEADNLENWEEQADSGMLDKRLEEMALDLQSKEEKRKHATKSNSGPDTMILSDDSGRTQYQPQVRILRREAKGPCNTHSNHTHISGDLKSSKHSKSLQQREAEYAQARLRIFGSLPPDDDEDDVADDDETSDEVSKVNDNNTHSQSSAQFIKPDLTSPHIVVLRQPKGPDGTTGFTNPNPT